mmetsp:Transcript_26093/g.49273  ORF Transcript_26093/g.49273 Transcript_26093/m.49273 type:complete len:91 (+) Transcript_26093:1699-1971(+)
MVRQMQQAALKSKHEHLKKRKRPPTRQRNQSLMRQWHIFYTERRSPVRRALSKLDRVIPQMRGHAPAYSGCSNNVHFSNREKHVDNTLER